MVNRGLEKGFSLIQIMISIGLASGLALIVAQVGGNASKMTNKLEVDADILSTYVGIQQVLSRPENCTETFLMAIAANHPNAVNKLRKEYKGSFQDVYLNTTAAPLQTYGSKQLKIVSYSLSDASPEVNVATQGTTQLFINFDRGTNKVSSQFIPKKIDLRVEVDADGKIVSCVALSNALNDIWKFSPINNADIYYSAGMVGINTAAPISALDVRGTAYFRHNYDGSFPNYGSGMGTGGLAIGWNGGSLTEGETDFVNFPGNGNGGFHFLLANNNGNILRTPLVIAGNGNVGIGTTNPMQEIHVHTETSNADMRLTTAVGNYWDLAHVSSDHSFRLNHMGNDRFMIDFAGRVGIGAYTSLGSFPLARLNIVADPGAVGLKIDGNGGAEGGELVLMDPNNFMGWHFDNFEGPGMLSSTMSRFRFHRGGTGKFEFYDDGNAAFAGTLTQNSDMRLKKEIKPISNALVKLMAIEGVTFKWKDKTRGRKVQMGVIAQDIEKVFPEAVFSADDGHHEMKSVSYQNLIAPLIQGIKELAHEAALKDLKIRGLEERIERLESAYPKR